MAPKYNFGFAGGRTARKFFYRTDDAILIPDGKLVVKRKTDKPNARSLRNGALVDLSIPTDHKRTSVQRQVVKHRLDLFLGQVRNQSIAFFGR